MLRVIIITIILTPHLSTIWTVLSFIGVAFFLLLTLGYIFLFDLRFLDKRPGYRLPLTFITSADLSSKSKISKLKRQADFLSKNGLPASGLNLFDLGSSSTHPLNESKVSILQKSISSILMEILKEQFQMKNQLYELFTLFINAKMNQSDLKSSNQSDVKSGHQSDLNQVKSGGKAYDKDKMIKEFLIEPFVKQITVMYKDFTDSQVYELLWLNGLMVIQEQIQMYKEMRHDYALTRPYEFQHIDDFNEYAAETADESQKWSTNVDKTNQQIVVRLDMSGKLHPAISKNHERHELDHLRQVFKILISLFKTKYPGNTLLTSNIIDVLFREVIICKCLYPVIKIAADPFSLNSFIIEKANMKILIQKGVKAFRNSLENSFCNFPPMFLISKYQVKRFSFHEKQKYVDLVLKYSKRATSAIDISAVRHEVIKEIKRQADEIAGTERSDFDEDPDHVKRYIRSLQVLQRKLEKKLKNLESAGSDPYLAKSGVFHSFLQSPRYLNTPHLSLQIILNDFYKSDSDSESNTIPSLSLFYFLDYLESRKEMNNSLHILRFSLAAENYRKMVWRVNTGIMGETPNSHSKLKNLENISKETHTRFQKEVHKIYNTFLKSSLFTVELAPDIKESFERYIAAFENQNTITDFHADDYQCVLRAQRAVILILDDTFDEFLHSDSYFKWARDVQKLRLLNTDPTLVNEAISSHAEFFEGSALMNTLENELMESCIKLSGKQSKGVSPEDEMFHNPSSFIILENEDINNEFSSIHHNSNDVFSSPKEEDEEDEVHAPGELLGLSSKITQIQYSSDRLLQEIDRVNHLFHRIVWVNSTHSKDLDPLFTMQKQILDQTKENLVFELGEFIRQKVKLESQEQKEALSPGQCIVTIKEVKAIHTNASSVTGKKVTYFLVEIEQKHLKSGWAVKRRYNDFDALHRKLRVKFPVVDDFDFPGKGIALWSIVRNEVKGDRMKALELYLQRLIDNKDISKSEHIRNFLSSNYNPETKRIFNFEFDHDASSGLKFTHAKFSETLSRLGVKKGAADGHNSKMLPFLDLRRKSIENEESDYNDDIDDDGGSSQDEDIYEDESNACIKGAGPLVESFTKLLTQIFDFKEQDGWLQENASLYLLDGILASKGIPEKHLKDQIMDLISEENLSKFIRKCKDTISLSPSTTPAAIKIETKIKLITAFSEIFSRKLGTEVTARNLTMFLEMLQSETLNKHILYTQLDSFVELLKNML